MNLQTYREQRRKTAYYEGGSELERLVYVVLGLCSEAGECANELKKVFRNEITVEEAKKRIKPELGDVLWYADAAAMECGAQVDTLLAENITKLHARHAALLKKALSS